MILDVWLDLIISRGNANESPNVNNLFSLQVGDSPTVGEAPKEIALIKLLKAECCFSLFAAYKRRTVQVD